MKRNISLWQLMGFAITSFGGTLLHFLYEWTNESVWTAVISGVNESTWEHMKLLFFPMFFFALFQYFFFRDDKRFWCIKLRGTLTGLTLIPLIFYMYNGIIGKSPDWFNIAIFFISAAIAYIYEAKLFGSKNVKCQPSRMSLIIMMILTLLFIIFTFSTPQLAIFRDPINGTYGI